MKKIFVVISLIALSVTCFAQGNIRVLTIDDAVNLALENNLSIKQSKMDLEILALKDKYSWNSVSPSISLSGGANGSNSADFKDSSKNSSSLGWSVGGSINLNLTPAISTSMKAAKLAYEAGEINLETAKRTLDLSIRKTFYNLIYFNENLELQERNLETAKQTYESNLKKYNQGRLDELNLLKSQYNYESKIPTITTLKSSYESSIQDFKIALGIDLKDSIELTGSLDDALNISLDEAILQQNLDNLPSIRATKKSIETAKNALDATKYSAYGPTVSFSISDSIGKSNRTTGGIKAKGDVTNSLSYSANVRIPLDGYLPWSSSNLSMQEQAEKIEKMEQSLEESKIKAEISIQNTYTKLEQSKTQLQLNEKNVELAQKTYDMTKRAYDMGSSDLLSLQTAEDSLLQAKYNVTNQKYSIISAILDLENTLGIPFGTLSQQANKTN